ncbi:unnamed protein product, partial [Laminaria digitata]
DGYSLGAILELEGTKRVDTLAMAIAQRLRERIGAPTKSSASTKVERLILVLDGLHDDVYESGFEGFFSESWHLCGDALAAFRAIGRHDAADLLNEAVDVLQVGSTATQEEVQHALARAEVEESLDELDDRYSSLAWSVSASLFEYIKRHRAKVHLN